VRFPDFKRRDKQFSTFRTRIIDGIRDGANFAGKYSVIKIGCGTGCRFYFVADVTSGQVIAFPLGGEDYGHLDLYFKLNSSLIIAVWDGDTEETCLQEGFKIGNTALTSLGRSSTPRKKDEYCSAPALLTLAPFAAHAANDPPPFHCMGLLVKSHGKLHLDAVGANKSDCSATISATEAKKVMK
jgi:hypothetical protein